MHSNSRRPTLWILEWRRLGAVAAVAAVVLLAIAAGGCCQIAADREVTFAAEVELSEDPVVAERLDIALTGFLEPLCRGEWNDGYSDGEERERYSFFYRSLLRGARGAEAVVLESYPVEDGAYMITVALVGGAPGGLAIARVVEIVAVPVADRYRFRCVFERRTKDMQSRTIGSVTYRCTGPFDEDRAAQFVRTKARIDELQGRASSPLQYYCFQSLDELLKAYGLVHDASKCNFLHHDLGFLWDGDHDWRGDWRGGRRFSTGTGDESFVFGYVRDVLVAGATDPGQVFAPYVNGVATYFGGYGLSGETVEELAAQFREELERRPGMDFLEEFEKGRGSSVQRHFSNYVMCSFLCREIAARCGEAAVLRLVESGAAGERFFAGLEELIGVSEHNFHSSIVRLIGVS